MSRSRHASHPAREVVLRYGGAALVLVVAAVLFTRFGFRGTLSRDEAIYVYGGQQLTQGIAPYVSIFDPKTPLGTLLSGLGTWLAQLAGRDHVAMARAVYLTCSCLTVLATYLLAARLWRSWLAGLTAALVFASFRGFAADALSGPDAKTPGVMFAVLSLWLLLRRQYFWAALAGTLGFLVWQPLALYAAVVLVVACFESGRDGAPSRRRAVLLAGAGAAVPVAVTCGYFLLVGAFAELVEATIAYPFSGVVRAERGLLGRLGRIGYVVTRYYGVVGTVLLWGGILVIAVAAARRLLRHRAAPQVAMRDPLVCVVAATMAAQLVYAVLDFQGYPDVFAFLVYGAVGVGGAVALVLRRLTGPRQRRAAVAVVLAAAVALTAYSFVSFTRFGNENDGLVNARVNACAAERILGRGDLFYAMGDPLPLVLMQRRNPDRFVYLAAGVDEWKVSHTPGGFDGWTEQVREADPAMVATSGWNGDRSTEMEDWLRAEGYRRAWLGNWRVFVDEETYDRAGREGVALSFYYQSRQASGPGGRELSTTDCR